MPRLILASGSPRRRELLTAAGFNFDMVEPDQAVECGVCSSGGPAALVAELALRKATDVLQRIVASSNKEHTLVLAADTVAECQGQILGKPRDEDHARHMLTMLSGREHRVYTGVHAVEIGAAKVTTPQTRVDATTLTMDDLGDAWLDAFLESEKWRGKAGAFGLQDGLGVVRVTKGSESNVVGLPMEVVTPLLADHGVRPAG